MRPRTRTRKKKASGTKKKASGTRKRRSKGHGGWRPGAGRKPALGPDGERLHHPHTVRQRFTRNQLVLVTVRVAKGLPSLRSKRLASVVRKALEEGSEQPGFRLVDFELDSKGWRVTCQAHGREALSAAIKGINVRLARAINGALDRTGTVIEDRYHLEVLGTPARRRTAKR